MRHHLSTKCCVNGETRTDELLLQGLTRQKKHDINSLTKHLKFGKFRNLIFRDACFSSAG